MLDVRTTIWSVDAPPVSGFSPVSPPEYSNSISNSSSSLKDSLDKDIRRFGITLIDFYIQGIEVIGSNPEYIKIKESLSEAASLKIRAKAASETRGFYEQERKLDAIDKAIEKDSQASSGLVGSILSGASKIGGSGSNSSEGSISNEDLKYKLFNLKDMLNSGLISQQEYEQKKKELLGKY